MTKEQKKIYMREWQKSNKEYCNTKAKEYYQKYKGLIEKRRRESPTLIYSRIRSNSIKRNIEFNIDRGQFVKWWEEQEQKCVYCDVTLERLQADIPGLRQVSKRLSVDRIDSGAGYVLENLTLCCLQCNFIKSNFFSPKEMREIGQKYIKPKWQ